jgi:hypothetical protein
LPLSLRLYERERAKPSTPDVETKCTHALSIAHSTTPHNSAMASCHQQTFQQQTGGAFFHAFIRVWHG